MKAPSLRHDHAANDAAPAPWWCEGVPALLAQLHATEAGLAQADAAERLRSGGDNRLAPPPRARLFVEIGRRLRNPLVLVLLAAGAVSALTGEGTSAWIIGAVILLSLLLDQAQQQRALAAAGRLVDTVSLRTTALRDGAAREVEIAALVPGDVVRLAAGSLVPADGVLLRAEDLFVQQSALTGESFPVEKKAGAPAAGPALDQAGGALFRGTSVISGTASLLVCRTGAHTQIGAISGLLDARRPDLAFENDLRQFGNFILRLTFALVLLVLLASGLAHRAWLESFMFAVALAVGLTPELLPMVVTVSLSRGALRLARAQVIVKRLSAIHNLGSMDVLCTDKTGTLTEAKIELVRHVDIAGVDSPAALEAVYLNSHFESGIRTPLEDAVLAHGGVDVAPWRKIDEVPFDFERRRLSVLLERGGERRLIVKGAPADVLAHCDRFQQGEGFAAWTAEARDQAQATLVALESDGFRVLGVAWKAVPSTLEDAQLQDENELVFAGFAAFLDPPKADARAALEALRAQGVHVKVLTGDSELVTRHVCEALGLPVAGVLLGAEIATLDDRALAQRARRANLFCRVDPIQKNRVIRALRARGHVVGYLGDGINDAPALHSADIGISVDTGADSARAAADVILLRHSLDVLSQAVAEGRRTFANTRKYILLGTSSNFGNMASMAAAAVFLPFLPMLPVQILLNNLLYDTASVALPLDRVEPADVAAPQHWDMPQLRRFMFVIGPVSSLFDLGTFYLLLVVLGASAAQFQSGWFVESLATQVLAIFVIRTRGPALAGRPHRALVLAAAAVLAVAAALPFTPLGGLFGLVALPLPFYGALLGMTLCYLLLLEAVKRLFYRARRAGAARKIPRHPRRPRRA
ncbi:magnesium-translocating P-type ATPase [Caenimonas terrae]|uniref:Magnesium-transporting ATPase, P-type 1 n=1 Tax=Caenimonas terrae TaxID=696074 RepID=A0ABW0NJW7_9BURK